MHESYRRAYGVDEFVDWLALSFHRAIVPPIVQGHHAPIACVCPEMPPVGERSKLRVLHRLSS
jgi:hypothetical protein